MICGFGASVLATIPGVKSIACCTVVPLAAIISVYLYNKANPSEQKFATGTGLMLGFFTGVIGALFASFFDVLITYLTQTNEFVTSFPQSESIIKDFNLGPLVDESLKLMKQMRDEIVSSGFSAFYTFMILISNLITYCIFGFFGGALAVVIINKQKRNNH